MRRCGGPGRLASNMVADHACGRCEGSQRTVPRHCKAILLQTIALFLAPPSDGFVVLLHSLDARAAAGVTRYAQELAAALRAEGEPVHELRSRPYEVKVGRRRFGGFLSMRIQDALRPWRKRDVLHSCYHYAPHPRADVVTVHDLFPEVMADLLGFSALEGAALARTTRRLAKRDVDWVCVSETTREQLVERHPEVPPGRTTVIPPGIAARYRPPGRNALRHPVFSDASRFNILCVADLNPRKRLDWLLEAVADVGDETIHVVHAGPDTIRRPPWAHQRDRETAVEKSLGNRLHRLGRVTDAELVNLYQGADLVVLPTLAEGFGFPPLEALSCGTPVAVTDLPIFDETMAGRGLRFKDASTLATVLRQARAAQKPTPTQRQASHEWVQRRFSWAQCASALRSTYAGRRKS